MATKRLTAAMVQRISPPVKGQVEYWDRSMPGFGLRVSYKGRKAWVVLTRLHGKLIRVTLGEWPIMSLAEAHKKATEVKRMAKAGDDPREQRQQERAEAEDARKLTFEVMADQFLSRYAQPKLRARTVHEYTRTLKGDRSRWPTSASFLVGAPNETQSGKSLLIGFG